MSDFIEEKETPETPETPETVVEATEEKPNFQPNTSYLDSMADDVVEGLASEIGWVKDRGKKSAREWLRNSNGYALQSKDALKGMEQKIDNLQKSIQEQREIARREERALNENMINTLKKKLEEHDAKIDEAVDIGDREQAKKYRKEYSDTEKQIEQAEKKLAYGNTQDNVTQQQAMQNIAQKFIDDNAWYNEDELLRAEMDMSVRDFSSRGITFDKALELSKQKLKRLYKDDFAKYQKPPEKSAPKGDVVSTRETSSSKSGSVGSLSNQGQSTYASSMKRFESIFPNATKEERKTYENGVMKVLKEDQSNFR